MESSPHKTSHPPEVLLNEPSSIEIESEFRSESEGSSSTILRWDQKVWTSKALIQPLVCMDVMADLTPVVPHHGSSDESNTNVLATQLLSLSRIKQVVLTSAPLIVADLTALMFCFLVAWFTVSLMIHQNYPAGFINNVTAVCLMHLVVGSFLGLFPASGANPVSELRQQLTSMGISLVLLVAVNGLVGIVSRQEVLTILLTLFPIAFIAPVARFSMRRICANFQWWGEPTIVLGASAQGRAIYRFLSKMRQRGLKPLGIVDNLPSDYWNGDDGDPSIRFLGVTDELVSLCRQLKCHWVVAVVASRNPEEVKLILNRGSLIQNFVVLNSSLMIPSLWVQPFDVAGLVGVHIRDRLLFPSQQLVKRMVDIVLSILLLLACSPLLLVIAILIRWYSPGPIFYRHNGRVGRGGRIFGALKIRTMIMNAANVLEEYLESNPEAREEWKRDQKLKNDPRVIPGIGNLLRRTSLDELPQLWNVLIGDMTLVGPRPIVSAEIEKYRECYPLYLRVRPGLTGLWQVSGRNNTTYNDRVQLDTYYVRNWSLWLDYFILLRTIRTVVMREGSY